MDTDEESESKIHFAALSIEDKKDCKLENNNFSQLLYSISPSTNLHPNLIVKIL
jgi:hypothetical protein